MSKKEKLLQGFKNLPKDFTFNEPIALLGYLGFTPTDKAKNIRMPNRFRKCRFEFEDFSTQTSSKKN
jgi:hypothetical protein